ncbi:WG repeat-containing protein [Cetobacterium sp.]|uniref:WG repeat-containing protein n=1 Tax=Cetobacterium sp. TaxID=2071632 RepID=UPI003F3F732E
MKVKFNIIFLLAIIAIIYFSDKIKMDKELSSNSYKGLFEEYVIEMNDDILELRNQYKTKSYKLPNFDYDKVISINDKGLTVIKNDRLSLRRTNYIKKSSFKFIQSLDDVMIVSEDDKYGLLDENLNIIISPKYEELNGSKESSLLRAKLRDKVGYITKRGEVVLPFVYENGFVERDGVIVLKKDGKIGAISKDGGTILEFKYDAIFYNDNESFIVKEGAFYYSINIAENKKEKLDLTWFGVVKKDKAFYEKDGKFGVIKLNGEKIIENLYTEFPMNYNNLIIAKLHEKYGLIDNEGKIVTPIMYDYIIPIGRYFFEAGIDSEDRVEIIDEDGKFILDGHYDNFIELNKTYLILEKNKIKKIINRITRRSENIDEIVNYNKDLLVYKRDNKIFVKKIK